MDVPPIIDLQQKRLEKFKREEAREIEQQARTLATRGLRHLPVAEGVYVVRTVDDAEALKVILAKSEAGLLEKKSRIFLDICESASRVESGLKPFSLVTTDACSSKGREQRGVGPRRASGGEAWAVASTNRPAACAAPASL